MPSMQDRPPAVGDELDKPMGDEGGRHRQHKSQRAHEEQAASHAEDA